MQRVTFDERDIKKIIQTETPARRFRRSVLRVALQLAYLVLLFFVFFFALNYAAFWKRLDYFTHAQPSGKAVISQPTAPTLVTAPPINYPPSIEIPKLSLTAPLTLNVAPSAMLTDLVNGPVQYDQTALPGQVGNMVIVGHSSNWPWIKSPYNTVFALIDQLRPGDQIVIPYQTQQYVYQVTGHKIVAPTDVSVLEKTDTPTLTLLTCYPVGTTRSRYLVFATLISGQASGVQQNQPPISSLPTPR